MDLIAQALAKREKLRSDLSRIEEFLAIAYELQGETAPTSDTANMSGTTRKLAGPMTETSRAPAGVGAETARIAASILTATGNPMATRDLVPLIEAHGIEIGGKDRVATLSARLGNDAKRSDGKLRLVGGKWHLTEWLHNMVLKETADTPTKDTSAASSYSNIGGSHGTTLADMLR